MTSQQLPERRPKKVNLNLLPPEYLPRKVSKLSIALVTATVVLACLIVPFILLKADVAADCAPLEDQVVLLNAQLNILYDRAAEAEAIQAQIDAAESALAAMEQDYETFNAGLVMWHAIIEEIRDLLPGTRVTLISITQSDSKVELTGTATDSRYFLDYVHNLEESDFFSEVEPEFGDCPAGEECEFGATLTLSGEGEE